ncbi:type II toxin-antitoxin system RelE/ParE family toxin [Candidatus Thiodictyon syntrophicum]|jgi:toxin ParE1/3/4|uniref:Plasmid stabilization protein n=1 Tax=Candidatus Thiodictyon syntrophicum TaxID=1166950 RepID=A0A2K8UGF4_9GAMM|nr:type II toxin-antitoxin system RelE/ParE family toxin [Candidatus Thiodictyon syntrophicum]AUB84201.1 plasmid stabilization protein [Candidatus Thiodictyon syntrophicum]
MSLEVFVTEDATRDLYGIFDYIADYDSPAKAHDVLDRLEAVIAGLADLPERGGHPKELVKLGIREYREVHFKPYRIVYRVLGDGVYVYLVADGRREMQTLLTRRLL